MLTFRDLVTALRKLEIDRSHPVIGHASLSAFGEINGGAETLVGAMLSVFPGLVMPAFTYKTMIMPEVGPEDNASEYGSGSDNNRMAEFFHPDMPADRLMGAVPEALRRHALARRSVHPILSFTGVGAGRALQAQNLEEPLAPIRVLAEEEGWVLLLGVDHTANTSIHYAERLASRKQFMRWALTPEGVVECPGFPGCSNGFQSLEPHLDRAVRRIQVGPAQVQAVPLPALIENVVERIRADRLALLCSNQTCLRCNAVRSASV